MLIYQLTQHNLAILQIGLLCYVRLDVVVNIYEAQNCWLWQL